MCVVYGCLFQPEWTVVGRVYVKGLFVMHCTELEALGIGVDLTGARVQLNNARTLIGGGEAFVMTELFAIVRELCALVSTLWLKLSVPVSVLALPLCFKLSVLPCTRHTGHWQGRSSGGARGRCESRLASTDEHHGSSRQQ
jgi:hypothetical protein